MLPERAGESKYRYKIVYEKTNDALGVTYKNADDLVDMYDQMTKVYDFRRIHKFEKTANPAWLTAE